MLEDPYNAEMCAVMPRGQILDRVGLQLRSDSALSSQAAASSLAAAAFLEDLSPVQVSCNTLAVSLSCGVPSGVHTATWTMA